MGNIEIYTKPNCNYCVQAKQLLANDRMAYVEHRLGVDFTREILLERYPFAKTYPVIVIDGMHIGGATELATLLETKHQQREVQFLRG